MRKREREKELAIEALFSKKLIADTGGEMHANLLDKGEEERI